MLRDQLDSATETLQTELRRLLEEDCWAAVENGYVNVRISEWPDGWKAAVVEDGHGQPVTLVGPLRRIEASVTGTGAGGYVATGRVVTR